MSETTLKARLVHPCKTDAEWASSNPVAKKGEIMISSDKSGMFKVGNGTSKWSELSYNHVTWENVEGKPSTFPPTVHKHTKSDITDFPTSMPASDVYAWAKAASKPSYSWNEITGKPSTFTPSSHSHANIISSGRKDPVVSGTTPNDPSTEVTLSGLSMSEFYGVGSNSPCPYGNVINVMGSSSAGAGELLLEWSGSDSTTGRLYYRSHRDTKTGGWGAWKTVAYTSDIPSTIAWDKVTGKPSTYPATAHTHDDRYYTESEVNGKLSKYLPLTGGTVSGVITATTSDATDIGLTATNTNSGKSVSFIVGSSGQNRGVYDRSGKKWMLYADENNNVYVNGTASNVPWSGVTGKPSTFTPSSHTHDDRYYTETEINDKVTALNISIATKVTEKTITTATDFNTFTTTGIYHICVSTNSNLHAPTANHGTLIVDFSVGTPYQIWIPDNVVDAQYKRTYTKSSSTWSGWTTQKLTDTVYTHPSYTAYTSGLYKITTNSLGHVTSATAVTKGDITALGIPGSDTNTWRGIQNNLTSDSTSDSLAAAQGKALKGMVDAVDKKVDGIEIGGRNLLRSTDIDKYGTGPWVKNRDTMTMEVSSEVTYLGKKTIKITGDNGIMVKDSKQILIKSNTKYVYSIMMYPLADLPVSASHPMHVWTLNSGSNQHHETIHKSYPSVVPKNTWTRVYIVLSVKDNLSEYYKLRPFLYGIGNAPVYVCEPKVEEGTMPTPWTPAPEDIDDSISSLSSRITTNANSISSLKTTVSNKLDTSTFENYKSHTHKSVIDSGNSSSATTFAYSKAGMNYGDYSWLAGWNGYELRAVNKNQFATSGHNHDSVYSKLGHTHTKSQITDFPTLGTAASKNTRTLTSVSHSSWTNVSTDQGYVPDMAFIAYWNGAYSSNGASNLVYCNRGAFGTIVTKNAGDYASAGHTHNYAGSSSVGGSANSAVKLTTARNIKVGGLSNFSFNFDGSGNISVDNWGYGTNKYVTTDSVSAPYFRIAYTETKNGYTDASMILMIDCGNTGGGFGILKVAFRSDNISTVGHSHVELLWLVRKNFELDQFFVKGYNPANETQYADLYFKASGTYNGVVVTALSMGARGSKSRSWTFDSGNPRSAADIRKYSYTTTSSDAGITKTCTGNASTATKLTTARSINGTNFDGSGNITTANWGTARTITIGNTGKSVNGGGNVSWSLSEIGAAASSHSHNYAGSSSAGGSATSAVKLDTATAGSATQPVYFSGGKPVACTYTLGKSVPSNAVFTDTNTWRGIQNNLTSDSTSDSLSAAQGKVLKGLVDGKANTSHTHTKSQITDFPTSMPASDVYSWAKASSKPSYSWSEITGKPSTFTPSSHTHSQYYDSGQSRTANTVLAAPNGSTGNATFRKLVAADIPALSYLPLSGGTVTNNTAFNKDLYVYGETYLNGNNVYINGKTNIQGNGLEIFHSTPYIDFHFNNDSGDQTSRIIELEKGKLNVNGTVCTNDGSLWCTSFSTDGGGTFGGDLSACRGLYLKHAKTSLYLYNDNGGFVIMHTGADGNSTWPVIWSFASSDIYFNSNLRVSGTGKFPNGLYAGSESKFYVNSSGGCTASSFTTDGSGTFGGGVNATRESTFCSGSYTDPLPGVICGIKVSGMATATRFYVRGRSGTWLSSAQPGGAGFECVNDSDSNALIPGWRIRNASGAWVGASYNMDKCFHLYYAKAERLSGNTNNGTDADFIFNANTGNFSAKSITQTSDERRKSVISSSILDTYKDFFMKIKPFSFKWKDGQDDGATHLGVGAQSVFHTALECGFEESDIGLVQRGKEYPGTSIPWSVSYTEFIPLNIAVTQDHETRIEKLEAHASKLERENEELKQQIKELKGLTA